MSSIVIAGDTSGTVTLNVPLISGSNTVTIPAVTGTAVVAGQNSAITAATQQTLSGTSVSFTGIPSWVKRITVSFTSATVSGSSSFLIQIGNGTAETTGYASTTIYAGSASGNGSSTSGFISQNGANTNVISGFITLVNQSGNIWTCNGSSSTGSTIQIFNVGTKTTSGTVSVLKFTTTNGTDTLGGSINILYE